jgi:hypothetical protein
MTMVAAGSPCQSAALKSPTRRTTTQSLAKDPRSGLVVSICRIGGSSQHASRPVSSAGRPWHSTHQGWRCWKGGVTWQSCGTFECPQTLDAKALVLRFSRRSRRGRSDRIGLDGPRWVLEGRRAQNYHVWNVWSPETSGAFAAFRELCLQLVRFSGVAVGQNEIY